MSKSPGITLRSATEADIPLIVALVHELADYERLADQCVADADNVRAALFDSKAADVVLAEVNGNVAGYALYFRSFSTFLMRPGIYLEDLFVRPEYRKQGVGLALLRQLAQRAIDCGYPRVEWSVLKWNQLAIYFYNRIGAEPLSGWTTFRLSGAALDSLAAQSGTGSAALHGGE